MLSLWLRLRDDPDSVADTIIVGVACNIDRAAISKLAETLK